MKKIILLVFMTLCLVVAALPTNVRAAESKEITSIEITYTEPKVGEIVGQYDTKRSILVNDQPITEDVMPWVIVEYFYSPEDYLPEAEAFKADTDFFIHFGLVLAEGYTFPLDSKQQYTGSVTVNGKAITGAWNPRGENNAIIFDIPMRLSSESEKNQDTGESDRLISEVNETTLVAKATAIKGYNKVSWQVDGSDEITKYQIFRSTKKDSDFKRITTTAKTSYKDKKNLTGGKKYYYKIRGYVKIDGKTYYTEWSNVISKTAK